MAGTIAASLASCSSGNKNTVAENKVAILDPGSSDLSHKDVMEIIGWTEIKADSSIFIGNVKKIETFDSEYYIMDNVSQKCVLRYDADGNLLNRIGKHGEGPDEYLSIHDFTIDKKNRRLLILSDASTVYTYNLNGAFERKEKLTDELICNITCNMNGLMATSGYSAMTISGDGYLLYEFNTDFQLIGQWIPFTRPLRPPYTMVGSDFLVTSGKHTYCLDNINLNLVAYNDDVNKIDTVMSFSLKNHMPVEIFNDMMRFMSEQRNYNWIKDFVITNSKIAVGYIYDGNYAINVFDKSGNTEIAGIYRGPFPQCFVSDNETIISPISSDFYLNYWADQDGIIKPSFNITEDTNLVLLKWRLK